MEISLSKENLMESIIFRANIFNYDNKFLTTVKEITTPISVKFPGKIK